MHCTGECPGIVSIVQVSARFVSIVQVSAQVLCLGECQGIVCIVQVSAQVLCALYSRVE